MPYNYQNSFNRAQAAYDAMTPPEWDEWTCDVCGMSECECEKCEECGKGPCECEPCPDCKGLICSCDEQYEAHKERCHPI